MTKRNSDDSQDSATAAPALRLSSNFQSATGDIELRSKDGVRFLVHKANLSVSSSVFDDMLQLATSGDQDRPSIEMDESADVLERMLPYCYPKCLETLEFNDKKDLELLKAFDKYELARGLEAMEASFRSKHEYSDAAIYALLFAHHRQLDSLFDLVLPTVLRRYACLDNDGYLTALDPLGFMDAADLRDLLDFLKDRKMAFLSAHTRVSKKVMQEISDGFGNHTDTPHDRLDWPDEEDVVMYPPCPEPFFDDWWWIVERGKATSGWAASCASGEKRFDLRCRCCSNTLKTGAEEIWKELRLSEKAAGVDLSSEHDMGAQYRAWVARKRASRA